MNSRVAVYIKNNIKYLRRKELEGNDCNLLIIDLLGINELRVINIYRSFAPQHNISQRDKFILQLETIKNAITTNTILLGDFNLDWAKKHLDEFLR